MIPDIMLLIEEKWKYKNTNKLKYKQTKIQPNENASRLHD